MLTMTLRRRRRMSMLMLSLTTLVFFYLWKYESVDKYSSYSSYNRFGVLFRGLLEQKFPTDFYRIPADNQNLVNLVRSKLISQPPLQDYNMSSPTSDNYFTVQSKTIDQILGEKENGYFVECGVLDGERESVTVFLETTRHWRGLLIEPNKDHYHQMLNRHRKAHTINACVRTDIHNYYRTEKSSEFEGYFVGKYDDKSVPCFWLTTLLLATGEDVIDLLTLDLHGHELDVLTSIDFEKIKIKTIKVEVPMSYNATELRTIMDSMRSKGYMGLHQFTNHINHRKDIVFGKNT